jgi:hypothetical protein
MPFAVVIDWVGPFASIQELREWTTEWGHRRVNSLYVAVGSRRRQTKSELQYVGITGNLWKRFNTRHPINVLLKKRGLKLFIGIVSSQAVAGRKAGHHHKKFSVPVYLAESALAFLLELPLNKDKRCSVPKDSIVLTNRWWKRDNETRYRNRPSADWPDFLEFEWGEDRLGRDATGQVVWFGRRGRKIIRGDGIRAIIERARAAKAKQTRRTGKTDIDEVKLEKELDAADEAVAKDVL